MKIEKTEKYTHIVPNQESIDEFIKEFKNRYSEFSSEHLIVDISEKINIGIEKILLFLNISVNHKQNGTSFVLVCKDIDIDDLPEEINVVPTFVEAVDIIEMEAIERDLGF